MPILLNIMKSLTFACAVLFFAVSQTVLGYDHDLDAGSYWDPVATGVQPRESDIEPLTTQPQISPGCPKSCSCQMNDNYHNIMSVDCSNKGLEMVPDFPKSTVKLLLRNNSLSFSTAPCDSFKFLGILGYLDLSTNMIVDLPPCFFQSQKNSLLFLLISENDIKHLDRNLFQNLSLLKYLDLSGNRIMDLAPETFSDLAQLINLNLSHNNISTIAPDALKGLYSLKGLDLQKNSLDVGFSRDVFQDLGALETLLINSNQGILDDALSPLKNLSYLSMNVNSGCTKLGTGFRQLINLSVLDLSTGTNISYRESTLFKYSTDCYLPSIPSDFFENIQTKKNFTLNMYGCHIQEIGNSTFHSLPTLVTLDLSYNPELNFGIDLECGGWIDSLANTTISDLDLSYTVDRQKTYFSGKCFEKLAKSNITTLYLRLNSIFLITGPKHFPTTIEKLIVSENNLNLYVLYVLYAHYGYKDLKLKELYAYNQNLQYVTMESTVDLPGNKTKCPIDFRGQDPDIQIICLPPDLETIYGNTALGTNKKTVGHVRVLDNIVLSYVYFTDNALTKLLGPIENVPSLKVLDLSRNQCERLDFTFFKYMVNLETLILTENFLGLTFSSDVKGLTFSELTSVKVLDISHNFISDLSSQAFIRNTNLETLDLSYNRLSEFQPSISTINNMSFLDLSVNLLSGLSEQTCEELKVLKSRNESFTICLLDNPLLFTCDHLPFLDLVLSNPHIFNAVEHMQFRRANGTHLFYKDLAYHFPSLARECLIQRFFDVLLVAFFVVVSTISIWAVIYHKRWKLRYLYYIGQRRMHIGEHMVDYAPDADVFITYDQDDLRWRRFMQQTFLPGLNQRNITYILGETDFPGGDLMAHVAGAVVGTRKTVVLLSGEIFDDHHREFEMNLAIMREMDTRSLKIVPVFVEEVDLTLYPQEIEIFLRNQWHRCLSYEGCDFWDYFVDAVKENN